MKISRKTQLLLAATIWTVVGCGLLGVGLRWLLSSGSTWIWLLLIVGLIVGIAKGFLFLRKSALRTINRIQSRPEGANIIGMFSPATWVIIAVMITGGRYLRTSGLADELLGALYASVGIALIIGSVYSWRAFLNSQ